MVCSISMTSLACTSLGQLQETSVFLLRCSYSSIQLQTTQKPVAPAQVNPRLYRDPLIPVLKTEQKQNGRFQEPELDSTDLESCTKVSDPSEQLKFFQTLPVHDIVAFVFGCSPLPKNEK